MNEYSAQQDRDVAGSRGWVLGLGVRVEQAYVPASMHCLFSGNRLSPSAWTATPIPNRYSSDELYSDTGLFQPSLSPLPHPTFMLLFPSLSLPSHQLLCSQSPSEALLQGHQVGPGACKALIPVAMVMQQDHLQGLLKHRFWWCRYSWSRDHTLKTTNLQN